MTPAAACMPGWSIVYKKRAFIHQVKHTTENCATSILAFQTGKAKAADASFEESTGP